MAPTNAAKRLVGTHMDRHVEQDKKIQLLTSSSGVKVDKHITIGEGRKEFRRLGVANSRSFTHQWCGHKLL